MIEFLIGVAPNTTKRFLSDLLLNYGIGVNELEESNLPTRYMQIKRFFGYSMNHDESLSEKQIQEDIKNMFREFEDLIIKYPDGVPNTLKMMNSMSNADKNKFFEERYKSDIRISLCHAIMPITHFNMPSLKDALVPRSLSIIEVISSEKLERMKSEQEFWTNIKKEFNDEEQLPF